MNETSTKLSDVVLKSRARQIAEDVAAVNAPGQLGDLGWNVGDVVELVVSVGLKRLVHLKQDNHGKGHIASLVLKTLEE